MTESSPAPQLLLPPDDPHNSVIVDIDHAPRNAHGLVEAVSDVEILRPTIATNGNRRLFYEVVNRGNKLGLALFNDTGVSTIWPRLLMRAMGS